MIKATLGTLIIAAAVLLAASFGMGFPSAWRRASSV